MGTTTRTSVRTLHAILVASCLGTTAWAATPCGAEMPCTFGISDTGIQMSKGVLKFQARISQAKMPIPQGELLAVELNLIDPTQTKRCGKKFNNVTVLNSILNLDFEPTDCALDQVVAAIPDLQLQLVIGGYPVKTIPLGTVPYALKANHAVKAQEAHHADVAAQAHYAHRITADRQTLQANAIGTGYFDFFTPQNGGNLYDALTYAQHAKDGFVQWTPVNAPPVLHFAAKGIGDDKLAMLETIYLESKYTVARGSVVIAPVTDGGGPFGLVVQSRGMDVSGGAAVRGGLSVAGGATISGGSTLNGGIVGGVVISGERPIEFPYPGTVLGKAGVSVWREGSWNAMSSLECSVLACDEGGPDVFCADLLPPPSTAAVVAISASTWANSAAVYASSYFGNGLSATSLINAGVHGKGHAHGVIGDGTGPGSAGVFGRSSQGVGVEGSGNTYGVHGTGSGGGVLGESSSGAGVAGASSSGQGIAGTSTTGTGVSGSSSSDVGVHGSSAQSHGVRGVAQAHLTSSHGVYGSSEGGYGVYGTGGAGGVSGESSNSATGVRGKSNSGTGVSGVSSTGSGVDGYSFSGYGGVFSSGGTSAQLRLVPLSAVPSTAQSGDIVMLANGGLRVFVGGTWKTVVVQ